MGRQKPSPRASVKGKRPDIRAQPLTGLSDVDERFARRYLKNGMNASEAYRFTHPKAKTRTSHAEGCQVLAKQSVQKWLQSQLNPAFQARGDELTAARVVEEIRRLALTPRMPHDEHGKVLPVHQWPEDIKSLVEGWTLDDDGNIKSVKLAGKGKGVELAAKYHRLIVDQVEQTTYDVGSMTKEQIRARLEQLLDGAGEDEE